MLKVVMAGRYGSPHTGIDKARVGGQWKRQAPATFAAFCAGQAAGDKTAWRVLD